jgi:hypothetical protein
MQKTKGLRVWENPIYPQWVCGLLGGMLLWGLTAQAVPPPKGVAPVVVPSGGFAIDGDLQANTPAAGAGDWLPGPAGAGGSVLDATGAPLNPATTFHFIDKYNDGGDNTFAGGLKWTDDPNTWQWTTSKASSKTDINNVLMHITTDASGHVWVVVAADRFSNSGDSYIDFEFLQNKLTLNTNGTFTSAGPNGGRTANDLLLSLDFASGGSAPDFTAWRWQTNTSGGFTYFDATAAVPAGSVFGAASPTNTPVPFGAFGGTNYGANQLVEAAIDLTALLGNFDSCLSIGFATVMVKTKTSTSSTASISDFINPIQLTLKVGPSAYAGPNQTNCTQGASTAFNLQGQATQGMQPISSTNWSVVSGTATIDSTNSLSTTAHVSSSSATLRLTVIQSNGCTETSDVVLTVAQLPTCSISGASSVCPLSSSQFLAPAGLASYSWTIGGNGSISGPTNAQMVTVTAGATCGATFTLGLNVANNNGCPSSCSSNVLVQDTVPPVISSIPADATVQCAAAVPVANDAAVVATDNCSGKVTVSHTDQMIPGTCANKFVIKRSYTATDSCGNSSSQTQTITVNDTTPPVITSIPADVTVQCAGSVPAANDGAVIATDNCGGAPVISHSEQTVPGTCANNFVIKRTYTATDACGLNSSRTQTITVSDTTLPVITSIPADVTVQCAASVPAANDSAVVATDNCGGTPMVTHSDQITPGACANKFVLKRTYTATDACGNSSSKVQTITVSDTTPPAISSIPADMTVQCASAVPAANDAAVVATDACGGSPVITHRDQTTPGTCANKFVVKRTYTATDACGNSSSQIQTITVNDTTPPTITSIPADVTVKCASAVPAANEAAVVATDACGGTAVITHTDQTTPGSCANKFVLKRTYIATDPCGNSSSQTQTITVNDDTGPVITSIPADVTVQCAGAIPVANNAAVVATDNCGGAPVVTHSDQTVPGTCANRFIVKRTYTATDTCGNSSSQVQTITVSDTTPPTITSIPADVTVQCAGAIPAANDSAVVSTDACGGTPVISHSDQTVAGSCANKFVVKRTYTATDACGNSASQIQTITVNDTTPPTITSIPADVAVQCAGDVPPENNAAVVASDACGGTPVITHTDLTNSGTCANSFVVKRTFTATDACGNSTNRIQTITVQDTIPPVVTAPTNVTIACTDSLNPTVNKALGMATAVDNCTGASTPTYSDQTVAGNCPGNYTVKRTWSSVDACGNVGTALQTITVQDIVPPVVTPPANITIACTDSQDPNVNKVLGFATATDGCSGASTPTYSDQIVAGNCVANYTIKRTWTSRDGCGNVGTATQTITVRDTTPPVLTIPPNVTLECPANTSTNNTGVATCQDNCSPSAVTYSDVVSNSCGGANVIFRVWKATDQCGNSSSATQTITVRDTTPPTITAPPNLVLECPADTSTNGTGRAIAQDGCGSVTIRYSDVVSNGCGNTKVISRTWTASDGCGNSASALQTITLIDTTPPAFKLPANVVQQCPGNTSTNVTGVPFAQDGCGSVTLSYSDVVSNYCGLTKTVWRTWTAVDQCGNSTNGVQIISVIDTTKPTITCPSISVQCVGDVPAPYADLSSFLAAGGKATDSCSPGLAFSLISDSGLAGRCPATATRVYRVIDACGNFADGTQTITVDDTIPPVLTCPANAVVECGPALDPSYTGQATATDNCDTNVAIAYSDALVQAQYNLSFLVADPDTGTGPYGPTYLKFAPGSLPCPDSAVMAGRALDPLRNAVAYAPSGQQDALTSIGNVPMCFGQIVPFETVIQVSGGAGPEHGTIEFTADWSTYTTSNNRFGYDTNYMVYCAFVDAADPGSIDPNNNARVESYSSTIVNQGTPSEAIRGTFRVSGLDSGDRVVVEIWVVLDSAMPAHSGGTVAAALVSAQTAAVPPVPITVGVQTDSLGNLSKIGPLPAPQPQPPLGPLPPQPPVLPGSTMSVINRTWTATDACGNASTCVQQITVRDTTPPSLSVPVDMVLECPADTSTNSTGAATATDACSSIMISYSDTVSNGCGGTRIVSRLWTAVDSSGNSTNALQIITVRDTTPPSVTAPANLVLPFTADIRTNATGVATASDGCSGVALSYRDAVTIRSDGSQLVTRTWTATDGCGNGASAVQTITLNSPRALILPTQSNIVLTDLTTLRVINTATNPNVPANPITYQLINPPAGASIDSNGIITWTPTLSQSPSTNLITTVVTTTVTSAAGTSTIRSTNSFLVTISTPYDGLDLSLDSDGDGLTNLVEFAVGSNPNNSADANSRIIIWITQDNSGNHYLAMKFARRTNAAALGLQYLPEVSADKVTWAFDGANVLTLSVVSLDSEYDWVTIRDQTPITPNMARFIRLHIITSNLQSFSPIWIGSDTLIQGTTTGTASRTTFFSQRMVLPVLYAGTVSSLQNTALTDTNANWTTSEFGSGGVPAYAEFDNGSMADIASSASTTKSLSLAGSLGGMASPGDPYRVRAHFTVASLFGTNNETGLKSGGNTAQADNIMVLIPQTQQSLTIFYYDDGVNHGWLTADYTLADNVVVYPEQGLLVRRVASGDRNLYLCGPVKTGVTMVPVDRGYNLVGTLKSLSPVSLGALNLYTGNPVTGLASGGNTAQADTLQVVQPDGTSATYFYYKDNFGNEGWLDANYNLSGTVPIKAGSAFFIHRLPANTGFNWTIPAE